MRCEQPPRIASRWSPGLLGVLLLIACGGDSQQLAAQSERSTVEKLLSLDKKERSAAICPILTRSMAAAGIDTRSLQIRAASPVVPQMLCRAFWKDAQERDREASLTVLQEAYEGSEGATASLRATVAQLEEGFTIKVAGRERTRQVDFEDFRTDVGDLAAWAPRLRELSVAVPGVRFAVALPGTDDDEETQSLAVALARAVIAELSKGLGS